MTRVRWERQRTGADAPASAASARNRRRLALGVLCLCNLLVLLILPAAVQAAAAAAPFLYVDKGNPNCSDSGTGTAMQPFCSIKPAALAVVAGQTVLVYSGTYNEGVTVSSSGTASAPITFAAASGATVTVTGLGSGSPHGFYLNGRSYVTVQGFNVNGTSADGIVVKSSSNITIRGNHVSNAGQPVTGKFAKGIRLDGASDSVVANNTVDHNTDFGIYLVGSTRNQVVANQVYENARVVERVASGIRLHSSTGNTVSANVSHDNEDSGIEFATGANNNLVVNNVTYKNGDHGIDNKTATGQRLIANTVYKNVTAGINVEGNSTGATIANNISVDNGIGSPRTRSDIRIEAGSTSGTTLDYDLVYLSSPDTILIWNSVSFTSLAAFKSATGQESHGTQADPRWMSAPGGNFHLTTGSPAIDSGNSGASGQPSTDADGNPRVDDPATANTGAGPRAYDDRGAYEFAGAMLDHIVISPASATISAGGSQAYTAQGFDASNNSLGDVTAGTTFSISPDGSCTGATCTASVAGAHTVTGTNAGKTGSVSLNVTTGSEVDHIVISPATATISAGGSQAYTAQGFDASNNSLGDVTADTTFSISPDGSCTGATCTAITAGSHTVTGNDGGKTSTASLTVTVGPLDHLVLSPASATIPSGGSQAYTAEGRDQYDNSRGDVTASTTFSIAPDGSCAAETCTASVAGAHTVTGTNAGKTGSVSLNVTTGSEVDHIVISPATATISAGGSQAYTAQGFDASNNSLGDVTADTTFSISPDGSCTGATCTAITAGSHTVTGNDGGKTSTASLMVSFVKNPGFETDLTGWNTSGSGSNITLTRVSGGHTGGWAARLSNTGTTTSTCALNDSPDWVKPTSAGTYTGTIWVRADSAGATLKLRFREYTTSGGTLVGSTTTQVTLTTSWQQVTVTYTIGSPGTSTLDYNAYVSSAAPGTCFYADDAAIIRLP